MTSRMRLSLWALDFKDNLLLGHLGLIFCSPQVVDKMKRIKFRNLEDPSKNFLMQHHT